MLISVISPVLNEARFVRAWAECVTRFSNDIHVADCGSTDGTLEILREYDVNVHHEKIGQPYKWAEGAIRNRLIRRCYGDWIVNLDADELLGDEFFVNLPALQSSRKNFHRFQQIPFWHSPNLIRVRQLKKDYWRRFYPLSQIRMFRNLAHIRYVETGNHAPFQWHGLGMLSSKLFSKTWDIPFYHYHFILSKGERENRFSERYEDGIKLMTYFGSHPRETRYYEWLSQTMLR